MTPEERENAIRDCLTALADVDTSDTNLRDAPEAWEAVEKLLDLVESAAYAEGRDDECEDWRSE